MKKNVFFFDISVSSVFYICRFLLLLFLTLSHKYIPNMFLRFCLHCERSRSFSSNEEQETFIRANILCWFLFLFLPNPKLIRVFDSCESVFLFLFCWFCFDWHWISYYFLKSILWMESKINDFLRSILNAALTVCCCYLFVSILVKNKWLVLVCLSISFARIKVDGGYVFIDFFSSTSNQRFKYKE